MPAPLVALGVVAATVVAVVLAVRALGAAVSRRALARRAEALAAPAAGIGLMPADALPDALPSFELLNTGTRRRVSSILRGTVHGVEVVVFDYAFVATRSGAFTSLHDKTGTAADTIVCARGSWMALPPFVMEPSMAAAIKEAEKQVSEQFGDTRMTAVALKLMSFAEGMAAGQPGLELSDRPDVRYRVRGLEPGALPAVFTPPVLDFFARHHGLIVEGNGEWLLIAPPRAKAPGGAYLVDRLPADQLPHLVEVATGALDVFRAAVH